MESGARLPTVAEVVAASGVKESTAMYRLRRFERGQISREELFLTVREALDDDTPRDERLESIPGMTKLERRYGRKTV